MIIRPETTTDIEAIANVEWAAFEHDPHRAAGTGPTEHLIVGALRADGALSVSLVADDEGNVVGHVACSPVLIDGTWRQWYGLGPIGVRPDRQRRGIGGALVRAAIAQLRDASAAGVVLVGDPAFYGRFGFRPDPRLRLDGFPPEYVLVLPLIDPCPSGAVTYHAAFFPPVTAAPKRSSLDTEP